MPCTPPLSAAHECKCSCAQVAGAGAPPNHSCCCVVPATRPLAHHCVCAREATPVNPACSRRAPRSVHARRGACGPRQGNEAFLSQSALSSPRPDSYGQVSYTFCTCVHTAAQQHCKCRPGQCDNSSTVAVLRLQQLQDNQPAIIARPGSGRGSCSTLRHPFVKLAHVSCGDGGGQHPGRPRRATHVPPATAPGGHVSQQPMAAGQGLWPWRGMCAGQLGVVGCKRCELLAM